MKFFTNVKNSIYGPGFYAALGSRSMGRSVGYFIGLATLLSIVTAVPVISGLASFLNEKAVNEFFGAYPEDLVVTLADGKVSINQPEPYFVPNPEEDDKKNLVTIDTKSEFSGSQADEYSTYVLVKEDFAVMAGSGDQAGRIVPFNTFDDIVITKEMVAGWGSALAPYAGVALFAASIILFIAFIVGSLFYFIYFLIPAVLILGIGRLLKQPFGFAHAYKVAIHAATLPLLASTAFFLFGTPKPFLAFTVLLLLVATLNLSKSRSVA